MSLRNDLLKNPNKFAWSAKYFSLLWKMILVSGYQKFSYLPIVGKPRALGRLLLRKSQIMDSFFQKYDVFDSHRQIESIIDIGSNNWFFLLQAWFYGIKNLFWIDIDPKIAFLYKKKFLKHVRFSLEDYNDLSNKYDLTMALSLTHWMVWQSQVSADADKMKILKKMFSKLSDITNKCAVVELVNSEDYLVKKHQHYKFNLSYDDYLDAGKHFFDSIEFLGSTSPSRAIYVFWK